ncbi:MAG: nicotinate-nucleotide adenylyltransferase [Halomonadaceae bacterium]|nr:MAG: nicotinate-nucleotide adenylyltransferase [Halomonadaceae bacterium]
MLHIIMGGTFDPVHNGHLRVAVELREQLGAAVVHLMPSNVPPHRQQPGASPDQRLHMLRLAVANEPGLQVDDRELRLATTSYTAETLRALRQDLGQQQAVALVLGMDAFMGLPDWHEAHSILRQGHVIVVERPEHPLDSRSEAGQWLRAHETDDIRQLETRPAGYMLLARPPLLAISATAIRERVAAGRSIRYLLPDAVRDYIQQQGLYRQGATESPLADTVPDQ